MTPNEVRAVKFREAVRGYRSPDVDSLLEGVAHSIEIGQDPRSLIEATHLHRAVRGYSTQQVNSLLSELSGIPESAAPWSVGQIGQHFGSGSVQPLADVPDAWIVPRAHHRLEVRLRARGVIRVVRLGTMDRLDPLLWPLSWLVHWCFYPRQWAVEVLRIPEGWRSVTHADRLVWSVLCRSKSDAVAERDRILRRIERLRASGA